MPGMPEAAKKPNTTTTCLTKSDYVPKAGSEQGDCKLLDQKISNNLVEWNVACKDSTGKGSITYAGDSFSGVVESLVKAGGKDMTVKVTMEGKRIGACPQE